MNTEVTSCHATVLLSNQPHDGSDGNVVPAEPFGDKSIVGFSIGGHMKWEEMDERLGKAAHGGAILAAFSMGQRTHSSKSTIWKWLAWGVIMTIVILTLLGCSSEPAWAEGMNLTASWYSESALKRDGQWDITHGRTASGQLFTDSGLTAASWDFPLGTTVKVTRTDTKASVVVLVNDRTARRFKGKRIDLSLQAMRELDGVNRGIVPVQVEVTK